jgi:hypothetical protein
VVDGLTGQLLGSARRQPLSGGLWQWLTSPIVEVREDDDEPLLCTLHRVWSLGLLWEVRDADGHLVGLVRRNRILNRVGQLIGVRRQAAAGEVRWEQPEHGVLAALTRGADGLRLRFADAVMERPFIKMALLAAALVLPE